MLYPLPTRLPGSFTREIISDNPGTNLVVGGYFINEICEWDNAVIFSLVLLPGASSKHDDQNIFIPFNAAGECDALVIEGF